MNWREMNDDILFLNLSHIWIILAGAGFLFLIFLWKEWSQSGKRRFPLKAFLALLAILSLVFLALKPAIPVISETGKGVLLTSGYEQDQIDSIRQESRNIRVIDYQPGKPLPYEIGTFRSLVVLGHGVKPYDLWQLEGVPATFLEGRAPLGIVALTYEREKPVGSRLRLQGKYHQPREGNRLVLEGPGGTAMDSVILKSGEVVDFELSEDLKAEGKFIYSLVEKDSVGEILSRDPLPVIVNQKEALRILVLNAFPSFESKYLKNFLAEGHQVVVRSQITTGRFKYEYFNTPSVPVGALSGQNLENFDLLVIDAASLRSLSASERNAVTASVKEDGLGIFVQPDDNYFVSQGNISSVDFTRDGIRELGAEEDLKNKYPFLFRDRFGLQPIHTSGERIYSAYQRLGGGRIGTTVYRNSYELLLNGQAEEYGEFWSRIIEKIAKKEIPTAEIESEGLVSYANEPFNFSVRTAADEPEITNNKDHFLPLKREILLRNVWKGTTWPGETGWNQLRLDTTAVYNFYVTDSSHWKSLSASQVLKENRRYFSEAKLEGEKQRIPEPVNPLWFYGLFLLSAGFLWLEPKL